MYGYIWALDCGRAWCWRSDNEVTDSLLQWNNKVVRDDTLLYLPIFTDDVSRRVKHKASSLLLRCCPLFSVHWNVLQARAGTGWKRDWSRISVGYCYILFLSDCMSYLFQRKRGNMFLPALVCLCVCVCLSVTTITKKIVDGFVPNFVGRFLGGKGRPSLCFVMIGRGMWK